MQVQITALGHGSDRGGLKHSSSTVVLERLLHDCTSPVLHCGFETCIPEISTWRTVSSELLIILQAI